MFSLGNSILLRKRKSVLNFGLCVNVKAASSIINCEPYCSRTYSNFDTEKISKRKIIRNYQQNSHSNIISIITHLTKLNLHNTISETESYINRLI